MNPRDVRYALRWYPAPWRLRYGEELVALLQETYGDCPLSLRVKMSLVFYGMKERIRLIRKKFSTYTAYSTACALVWAVILTVVLTQAGDTTRHTFALVCGGWWIGWLSATIGRVVYPPPKPRKRVS
ncbi:MAG: hypothetical protein J2P16_05110 [Mycobacterium sp.]|nr:hypothetical protein [Mycobacterium sp.]